MFDFGEDDEQIVKIVKSYAQSRAEQAAREKVGVYLSNYSKTKNLHLIENEISTITNNIVEITAVEYKKTYYNAYDIKKQSMGEVGIMYEATVKVNIDTDGIANYLKRNDNEKANLIAQNETLQQSIKQNENEFENLRKRAESAKTDSERMQIKNELNNINKDLQYKQIYRQGNKLYYQKDYKGAIAKYNEAIKVDSKKSVAYNNRGLTYSELGEYQKAIEDFNKSIELNPQDNNAYNNRGTVYDELGQYEKAVEDYNKAIELDENYFYAWNNIGNIYLKSEDYKQAIILLQSRSCIFRIR